jgi:hypothetical protein
MAGKSIAAGIARNVIYFSIFITFENGGTDFAT